MPEQELSYGQKAVGLTFNPSNLKDVDDAKQNCADVIDRLFAIKHSPDTSSEKARLCEIAIVEMQGAQMWAVKAITWKD